MVGHRDSSHHQGSPSRGFAFFTFPAFHLDRGFIGHRRGSVGRYLKGRISDGFVFFIGRGGICTSCGQRSVHSDLCRILDLGIVHRCRRNQSRNVLAGLLAFCFHADNSFCLGIGGDVHVFALYLGAAA